VERGEGEEHRQPILASVYPVARPAHANERCATLEDVMKEIVFVLAV
jgi:hypothetical protein